jgi:hypothetical protein
MFLRKFRGESSGAWRPPTRYQTNAQAIS